MGEETKTVQKNGENGISGGWGEVWGGGRGGMAWRGIFRLDPVQSNVVEING